MVTESPAKFSALEDGEAIGVETSTGLVELEFIKSLFWSLEVYYQDDSRPLAGDATSQDYGITTALGWSL